MSKKKIYKELVAIRKELQAVRKALESNTEREYALVRKPYSTRYELAGVKTGLDESLDAK